MNKMIFPLILVFAAMVQAKTLIYDTQVCTLIVDINEQNQVTWLGLNGPAQSWGINSEETGDGTFTIDTKNAKVEGDLGLSGLMARSTLSRAGNIFVDEVAIEGTLGAEELSKVVGSSSSSILLRGIQVGGGAIECDHLKRVTP